MKRLGKSNLITISRLRCDGIESFHWHAVLHGYIQREPHGLHKLVQRWRDRQRNLSLYNEQKQVVWFCLIALDLMMQTPDVVDELSATYDVSRNSKLWLMTIFYGVLNITAINANIIFQENASKTTKSMKFLRNLILSLIQPHLRQQSDKKYFHKYTSQKLCDRISSQLNEPLQPVVQIASFI